MYLKTIALKKFRKYEKLVVEFKPDLNVLIGENDSGKSTIIDAIRYLFNTKSFERNQIQVNDFYSKDGIRKNTFEISALIGGLSPTEAGQFLEWTHFNDSKEYELRISLKAKLQANNQILYDIKAGPENSEIKMAWNAQELLKVTYLKPLRDAEVELNQGYRSRLAQILLSHKAFQKEKDEEGKFKQHFLEEIIEKANMEIKKKLNKIPTNESNDSKTIIEQINAYLTDFLHEYDPRKDDAELKIASPELHKILRLLSLELEDNTSGLGTLNKLVMAAELLHLETEPNKGLKLCLTEELEAHLHPQAQLRVIRALEEIPNMQMIVTTHSTTLGSSIPLDNLILCKQNDVYPMWRGKTELKGGDYKYIERFLNATKANMFFARGILMVEGDAENIIIPTIAEIIGKPLHKYGVSIVNVGGTAFLRYAKIFMRKDNKKINIPVAVITDLDIPSIEHYNECYTLEESYELPEGYIKDDIFDKCFVSKKKLISEIRKINIRKNLDFKISKTDEKDIKSHCTEHEINGFKGQIDNYIKNERKERKKSIETNYYNEQNPNIKVYLSPHWTLEYDIAMSEGLREYISLAILVAKKIKNNDNFNFDQIPQGLKDEAKLICKKDIKNSEIAYELFKPFLSINKPSKSVTAQVFSQLLLDDIDKTKNLLQEDKQLKYIVDAINEVCIYQEEQNE